MKKPFFGRKQELESLKKLFKKKSASLVVVTGRRRIGKSRLIQEFAKEYAFFHFYGLPPTKDTTATSQRNEFAGQLSSQIDFPRIQVDDWSDLFRILAKYVKEGKVVILFDEVSWMGSKDPDFLGKLKNAWDMYFKNNPQLMLVLADSASSWISKNILSSTGFMGRISYRLTLEELPLKDCNKFWSEAKHISSYDKLKFLAVAGGVPRYLEGMDPSLPAEENIRDMCFKKGGLLVYEFNDIFSDLFSTRSSTYKEIILILSQGPLEIKEICNRLGISRSGLISEYLNDLVKSGFISRDYTWLVPGGKISRLSHFRLGDNYLRFYVKYIDKELPRIENNAYAFKSLSTLPGWSSIMGFQFENLVLNNRDYIRECLRIQPEDVICNNPFFQRKRGDRPGVQIDYLIQTKFNSLYICEIKFSSQSIGRGILGEVEKKINNLIIPKGYSCFPVLIQVNGVNEDVVDSNYFTEIINFGDLLDPKDDE